jgi:hypothetical protein
MNAKGGPRGGPGARVKGGCACGPRWNCDKKKRHVTFCRICYMSAQMRPARGGTRAETQARRGFAALGGGGPSARAACVWQPGLHPDLSKNSFIADIIFFK